MAALPPLIHHIFPGHSTLFVLVTQSYYNMRTYMITQKTNAVQREIDRTDNPLDTLYKIYEIMIMTVIKLKKLLESSLR